MLLSVQHARAYHTEKPEIFLVRDGSRALSVAGWDGRHTGHTVSGSPDTILFGGRLRQTLTNPAPLYGANHRFGSTFELIIEVCRQAIQQIRCS